MSKLTKNQRKIVSSVIQDGNIYFEDGIYWLIFGSFGETQVSFVLPERSVKGLIKRQFIRKRKGEYRPTLKAKMWYLFRRDKESY